MNPVRSSLIVLQAPAFHRDECPDGLCHWCGLPLRFQESATWHNRQRVRHKGDRQVELPANAKAAEAGAEPPIYRDCDREFKQSMVWNGQNALRWHAWRHPSNTTLFLSGQGPNYYEVRCVDCEELCESGWVWVPKKRVGFATRKRKTFKKWEADHQVELTDGGVHALENLRPRCCECHAKKTTRERRRRADADWDEAIELVEAKA
jgi:hypothetical protein